MGDDRQLRHAEDALLHAFAARQVHPGERAVIRAHLQVCPSCRERLAAIQAMRSLFAGMAPAAADEPNEMRWRWMSQRIRARLEEHTARDLRPRDLVHRWRWAVLGAGVVAAGAAVLILSTRPSPHPPQSGQAPAPAEARASMLSSGDRPLDLTLGSGAALRLAPDTRVVARTASTGRLDLELEAGQLDVRLPMRSPDLGDAITLRTPAFALTAASGAFSVGYEASASKIEVHEGEVRSSPTGGAPVTLRAGQGQLIRRKAPPQKEDGTVEQGGAKAQPEAPTVLSSVSSEGETTVEVIGAPVDPIAERMARANASYAAGDFDAAIALAQQIAQEGERAHEVKQANDLLCRAYISRRLPKNAIESCKAALEVSNDPEDGRAIEYRIATIYRQLLSDCSKAIEHYNRAMVFGRASTLDDAALLGRAHCFLETSELSKARSDIDLLERRPGTLVSLPDLVDLKEKLEALERTGSKN